MIERAKTIREADDRLPEKFRPEDKTIAFTTSFIVLLDELEEALKGSNLYEDALWDWAARNPDRTLKAVMKNVQNLTNTLKRI